MKNTVFWDVMPCGLVEVYQHIKAIKGMYVLYVLSLSSVGPEDEGRKFFQNVGKLLPYNISYIPEASILEWC
jgi:hypothetical protein